MPSFAVCCSICLITNADILPIKMVFSISCLYHFLSYLSSRSQLTHVIYIYFDFCKLNTFYMYKTWRIEFQIALFVLHVHCKKDQTLKNMQRSLVCAFDIFSFLGLLYTQCIYPRFDLFTLVFLFLFNRKKYSQTKGNAFHRSPFQI